MKRKHRRRLARQDVRQREPGQAVMLVGQIVMPVEIQELKRITDDFNAPSPPTVEWAST